MKKLAALGAAVALLAVLGTACSGKDSHSTDRARPTPETVADHASWPSNDELATLTAIRQEPRLDAYDPACVLDKVETHFSSLVDFGAAAQAKDAEFEATVTAIASDC